MFQLTKVGLPVNVVNGVNPLSNGMINPTGNKARTDIWPDLRRNYQIPCKTLLLQSAQYVLRMQGGEGGGVGEGESMEFSMISSCLGWETARVEGGREGKNFLKISKCFSFSSRPSDRSSSEPSCPAADPRDDRPQ